MHPLPLLPPANPTMPLPAKISGTIITVGSSFYFRVLQSVSIFIVLERIVELLMLLIVPVVEILFVVMLLNFRRNFTMAYVFFN